MPLMLPLSNVEAGVLSGQAWWIDRFGNAQINFGPEDLALLGIDPGSDVKVTVGTRDHAVPWVVTYGEVEPGKPLLHIDSYGLMALAVREGRADEWFGLSEGTVVALSAMV